MTEESTKKAQVGLLVFNRQLENRLNIVSIDLEEVIDKIFGNPLPEEISIEEVWEIISEELRKKIVNKN